MWTFRIKEVAKRKYIYGLSVTEKKKNLTMVKGWKCRVVI